MKNENEEVTYKKLSLEMDKSVGFYASVDGVELVMMPREYQVLEILARNADKVVSFTDILDELYKDEEHTCSVRVINVFVCNIRKAIRVLGGDPCCILNYHGLGYRLMKNDIVWV